ncbi:hypothetical protein Rhal01_02169 [Rubritalea halochordaticola]|uniref:Uncharacterized protein n=1 Tax=Rubritalea halochordaticola TaxID=714537 RepID=A0ABP9V0G2_9BACT
MIRRFTNLILIALSITFLTSCNDTPEKVMEDKLEVIDESIQALSDLAEGKLSVEEGRTKFAKLKEEGKKIKEREDKLCSTLSAEEKRALMTKYAPQFAERVRKMQTLSTNLYRSGKMDSALIRSLKYD